jgi:hypothetical protein
VNEMREFIDGRIIGFAHGFRLHLERPIDKCALEPRRIGRGVMALPEWVEMAN